MINIPWCQVLYVLNFIQLSHRTCLHLSLLKRQPTNVQVRDDNCTIEWRLLENVFDVLFQAAGILVEMGILHLTKLPHLTHIQTSLTFTVIQFVYHHVKIFPSSHMMLLLLLLL